MFNFPYEPWAIQTEFMTNLYETIENKKIGIFESPTGTGKSLSLICGSLKWISDFNKQPLDDELEKQRLRETLKNEPEWVVEQIIKQRFSEEDETPRKRRKTKVSLIYSSRTHSQISQFVKEIKKTSYEVNCITLGSRTNLCINKSIGKININEKCLDLQQSKGCQYKIDTTEYAEKAKSVIKDIEDLKILGSDLNTCPYYGTRDAAQTADIICVPYNLLLHETTRKACGINLQDNVLQYALDQLQLYYDKYKLKFNGNTSAYIKQIMMVSKRLLKSISLSSTEGNLFLTVPEFLVIAELDHVNFFKIIQFVEEFKLCNKILGFHPAETAVEIKLKYQHSLQNIISQLQLLADPDEDGRILVSQKDTSIQYLLLNPAHKFQPIIAEARSIIFAGGTMAPVDDFISQVYSTHQILPGTPNSKIHQFSCGHVIPKNQLLTMVSSIGINGVPFEFTYGNRNSSKLLQECGNAILQLAQNTPAGMILFFPSYQYMEFVTKEWYQKGISQKLQLTKPVFVEKAGSDILSQFTEQINKNPNRGAILLAVVGGSLSEGINFSDDYGRLVVMISLPFANRTDPALQEKLTFWEKRGKSPQLFYENMCMKAVNQCIGRVIRHRGDYAAILLLDKRYAAQRIKGKLPNWIRDAGVQEVSNFSAVIHYIKEFFESFNNIKTSNEQ